MSMDVMLTYMDSAVEYLADLYNTDISLTSVLHTFILCILTVVCFTGICPYILFIIFKAASLAASQLKQVDFDGVTKSLEEWAGISAVLPQLFLNTIVYCILETFEWLAHPWNETTLFIIFRELIRRPLIFIILIPDRCNALLQRLADMIKYELTRPERELARETEKDQDGEKIKETEKDESDAVEEYWKGVWAKVPKERLHAKAPISELEFRKNAPWNKQRKVYSIPKEDDKDSHRDAPKPTTGPIDTVAEDPTLEDEMKPVVHTNATVETDISQIDEKMQMAIMNSLEINNNTTCSSKAAPMSILEAYNASCAAQLQLKADTDEESDEEDSESNLFSKLGANSITVWNALAIAAVGVIVYKKFA